MRILFTLSTLWERFLGKYRFEYYSFLYSGQVAAHNTVRMGKNSSVLIFSEPVRISIGSKTTFRKNCTVLADSFGKLTIGSGVFFNNECSINCFGEIEIGDDTLFGEGVKLYDHNHTFNKSDLLTKEQGYSIGKIKIGRNCWIGSGCIILKNVVIGDNVVIGAGCVISSSVPSGMLIKAEMQTIASPIIYR